jgi:hypothetical protein
MIPLAAAMILLSLTYLLSVSPLPFDPSTEPGEAAVLLNTSGESDTRRRLPWSLELVGRGVVKLVERC